MRPLIPLVLLALAGGLEAQPAAVPPLVEAPRLDAVVRAGFVVPPRPAAAPTVAVTVSETTYPVEGASTDEILASIEARSPFRHDDGSKRSDAFTAWSLRWTFETRPAGRECRVEAPHVTLSLETTTFAWDPPPSAPLALVAEWGRRAAVLLAHERDHQAIAALGALDVADALLAVRASCDRLRVEANRAGQGVLARLREVNAAFDAATGSGTVPPPGAR